MANILVLVRWADCDPERAFRRFGDHRREGDGIAGFAVAWLAAERVGIACAITQDRLHSLSGVLAALLPEQLFHSGLASAGVAEIVIGRTLFFEQLRVRVVIG